GPKGWHGRGRIARAWPSNGSSGTSEIDHAEKDFAGRRRLSALARAQSLYTRRGDTRTWSRPPHGRVSREGRSPDPARRRTGDPGAGFGLKTMNAWRNSTERIERLAGAGARGPDQPSPTTP